MEPPGPKQYHYVTSFLQFRLFLFSLFSLIGVFHIFVA